MLVDLILMFLKLAILTSLTEVGASMGSSRKEVGIIIILRVPESLQSCLSSENSLDRFGVLPETSATLKSLWHGQQQGNKKN